MQRDEDTRVGGVDLWSMVATDPEVVGGGSAGGKGAGDGDSSTLLVAGDAGSGKSSLIQMFLKPNSSKDPKSTFALEYNFARRKNAGAGMKSLAHIWELGGDIKEPGLLGIPLTTTTLPSASVMIVVDLSQPQNVLTSLQRWIQLIREHIQAKMGEIKATSSDLAARMKAEAKKRYGGRKNPGGEQGEGEAEGEAEGKAEEEVGHEDLGRVRPCEVPIIIVGNKYDQFRTRPSADRRALMQAIRFMAHYHGASFIATSRTDSSYRDSFRSVMNTVAFALPMKSIRQVTGDKPTHVSAGMDTFRGVLLATGTGKTTEEDGNSQFAASDADIEAYVGGSGVRKDCWGRFHEVLGSIFGAPDASAGASAVPLAEADSGLEGETKENGAAALGNEYPEADIDEARAAMDVKLDQYILDVERRERLNASNEVEAAAATRGSELDDDASRRRK